MLNITMCKYFKHKICIVEYLLDRQSIYDRKDGYID